MNELLKQATRMFAAFADFAEYMTAQEKRKDASGGEPQIDAKPTRTRKPKAEVEVEGADPMLQSNGKTPVKEMTEAESLAAVQDAAKAIVQRFPNAGNSADGRPEGFAIAKKLLAEEFRVGKLNDLVHAQRLQFIIKVKAIIAVADKQPAAAVGVLRG